MAETALLLVEQPLPRGHRVAVLSNAGGMGVLAADAADEHGLVVPELSPDLRAAVGRSRVRAPPAPATRSTPAPARRPSDLAAVADLILGSGEVDALVVVLVATGVGDVGPVMDLLPGAADRAPRCPAAAGPDGRPLRPGPAARRHDVRRHDGGDALARPGGPVRRVARAPPSRRRGRVARGRGARPGAGRAPAREVRGRRRLAGRRGHRRRCSTTTTSLPRDGWCTTRSRPRRPPRSWATRWP